MAGSVYIDGGDGSDTYIVNFGVAAGTGTITIADSGTAGNDTLTLNGTPLDDTLAKGPRDIRWRPTGDTVDRQEVDFDGMEGTVTLNAGPGTTRSWTPTAATS